MLIDPGFRSIFTVHAVTFERPLSDSKSAAQAAKSTGRSWPKPADPYLWGQMNAPRQRRTFLKSIRNARAV